MEILILLQSDEILSKELFTPKSLTTLVGLTGMVYVASNSLQKAFNFNPKWLALVIAEILSLLAVYISHQEAGGADIINYLIGVFNGFLVYLTSAGATGLGDRNNQNDIENEIPTELVEQKRKFSTSWW